MGDPGRVRQVLMNLVNNAIKFTVEGGVTVTVEMRSDGFRVNVIDTGIGIPPEKQDRIFLKFSQADASTTRKFGGSGLGLAISKRLMELMDGVLGFESIPEKGSNFWLRLPAAPLESEARMAAGDSGWIAVPDAKRAGAERNRS